MVDDKLKNDAESKGVIVLVPTLTNADDFKGQDHDDKLNGEDNKENKVDLGVGEEIIDPINLSLNPGITDVAPENTYKQYKRRWIGLLVLCLLNIMVSWCWLVFASVPSTSAEYFKVKESTINWLTTGYLFAYVIASPMAMYFLNKNLKVAMLISGGLALVSSWIRYGGTRSEHGGFTIAVIAQVVCGFAQPFVLAAPTRFSHVWFDERGRITATALSSLSNPLGGALGQLVGPLLASSTDKLPTMVLWVAVITTIIVLPIPFIPSGPPSPPCPNPEIKETLNYTQVRNLLLNPSFHLVAWPFIIYVAAFTATSSLLSQIMAPYGYTVDQAGIDGAVLIVSGLLAAAIISPLLDRRKKLRLITLKVLVVILVAGYLALIFVPRTRTLPAPFIISALIGAASFVMLPLALELLADLTHPIGPEVSSTFCWTSSQFLSAIFIIVMGRLKSTNGSMDKALIFQAVLCCAVLPPPMFLGKRSWRKREEAL